MKWSDCKYAVLIIMINELTNKFFVYPIIKEDLSSACEEASRYRGDMIALFDQSGNYYPIKK